MNVLQNFKFLDNATTTGESNILYNANKGGLMALQIDGDATTFSLSVKGLVNNEEVNLYDLAIIKTSDFTITNSITAKGIYNIIIDGVSEIKVVVNSVSGGGVNAFGKVGE
jgi:hypothetical protein